MTHFKFQSSINLSRGPSWERHVQETSNLRGPKSNHEIHDNINVTKIWSYTVIFVSAIIMYSEDGMISAAQCNTMGGACPFPSPLYVSTCSSIIYGTTDVWLQKMARLTVCAEHTFCISYSRVPYHAVLT